MPNVDAPDLQDQESLTGTGNKESISKTYTVPTGTTVAIADVIRPLVITPDFRMEDLQLVVVGANASATISVGYASEDGTDVDAEYFIPAGQSIATSSRLRATAVKAPKAIRDQKAYLTITVAGATVAAGTVFDVTLDGKLIGSR